MYYGGKVQVVRVISGDNELAALEFQKHYRLPLVHLLDPDRRFEKQHNRNGWPFLVLADPDGRIVFQCNGLLETERRKIGQLLADMLGEEPAVKTATADGIAYMPATLEREGETTSTYRRDRFPSVACAADGKVYVAFTTNRNGNSDVFMRAFDGTTWSEDMPAGATGAEEFDGTVTVGSGNRVWLSWTSNAEAGKYNIFVASLTEASGAVEPERVTDAPDDAMHARMACAPDGSAYLTYYKWHRMGNASRDKEVYLRRWSEGKWSREIRVGPTDVSAYEDHSDPTIIAHGDGAVVGWSWDYHRPKGYPQTAAEPTIFVRAVDSRLKLSEIICVSGKQIDMTPTLAAGGRNRIWCAWPSLARTAKRLIARDLDATELSALTNIQTFGRGVLNVCTPTLTGASDGSLTLLWSETPDGNRWTLKRSDLASDGSRWAEPETVESQGNPRFCSAAYDGQGGLWVAYAAEAEKGTEIVVRRLEGPSTDTEAVLNGR